MITIILLAIVGAIIAAAVGTFWYSNSTPMGKIHMKYLGCDKLSDEEMKKRIEEAKPHMMKMYVGQLLLSFVTAFAVVFIVTMSKQNGLTLGMATGFVLLNWLCFIVPTVGSGIIWSNCDKSIVWKKFFSDIFSVLVTILLTILVTSFFI